MLLWLPGARASSAARRYIEGGRRRGAKAAKCLSFLHLPSGEKHRAAQQRQCVAGPTAWRHFAMLSIRLAGARCICRRACVVPYIGRAERDYAAAQMFLTCNLLGSILRDDRLILVGLLRAIREGSYLLKKQA